MFHQLLTPVGDSMLPSFLVAAIPIVVVLALLGVLRRPAWQASLAGLVVAFIIAVAVWQLPVDIAASSVANGIVFAAWNVMWIVFSALVLYNIAVKSGPFRPIQAVVVREPAQRPAPGAAPSSDFHSAACSKAWPASVLPWPLPVRY